MWKTNIAASGGSVKELYVKRFYDPHVVKELNKEILNAPRYDAPLTVSHFGLPLKMYTQFTVGNTVPMDRFISTSTSPDVGSHSTEPLIRIDLPRGFPALVIRTYETHTSKIEKEVLLPFTLDITGDSLTYGIPSKLTVRIAR
jgi:hypothetical protein